MTHRQAYLEVQSRHFAAATDPAKVREQVIAEQNAAQRSTSITRNGAETVRQPGPRNSRDVVAEVVARAERNA